MDWLTELLDILATEKKLGGYEDNLTASTLFNALCDKLAATNLTATQQATLLEIKNFFHIQSSLRHLSNEKLRLLCQLVTQQPRIAGGGEDPRIENLIYFIKICDDY